MLDLFGNHHCTKGHEYQCENAKCKECDCDCGGRNHGIKVVQEKKISPSRKIILHLCADTGSDSKPWRDAGYEVILVGSKIGVENFHPPAGVYGIIANPVCTEFSTARSNGRARNPEKGMELVRECQRIIKEAGDVKFWVIENPGTGRLKDFLGVPVMTYEPWHFGSPWTKKTALWGKFQKPEKVYSRWEDVPKIKGLYQRPGRGKPSLAFMHKSAAKLIPEFAPFSPESDMEFRSLCSQKFAQAFFKANHEDTKK